jgi:type II secretory pathway predicted ATPase ExeA
MDRELTRQPESVILPSRRQSLSAIQAALQSGPVLLTGEAGIGKTWLARRLRCETATNLRWIEVDLAPSTDPDDLFRAVAHSLGLELSGGEDDVRFSVAEALAEQAIDGRRWGLCVDEAQVASNDVLEEVRVLSNRLGQSGGFAALLIIGQTPLSRRVDRRTLAALEARLSLRAHLRPLDADEAKLLLDGMTGGDTINPDQSDDLHRASEGNPQRLLRLAGGLLGSRRALATPLNDSPTPNETSVEILPSRPPLSVGEGMIEVGWDADPEMSGSVTVTPPSSTVSTNHLQSTIPHDGETPNEEPVSDHYAALQAWNEWARNQGRGSAIQPSGDDAIVEADLEHELAEPVGTALQENATVWAEGQQGFAPYSHLFSRLQSKDIE